MADRNTQEYREFRIKVLERDGRKCRICGATKYLEVHHIETVEDHPSLLLSVSNGITLCRKHHYRVKCKEKLFESLFKNLVQKKELSQRDYLLIELLNKKGKIAVRISKSNRRKKKMAKSTKKQTKTKMPMKPKNKC